MSRRRVVTGIDADGKSIVTHDGPSPVHLDTGSGVVDVIWRTDALPPALSQDDALSPGAPFQREPPPGGLVWRLVEFPPRARTDNATDSGSDNATDNATDSGDDDGGDNSSDMPEAGVNPDADAWHATHSLDFGVVLSGEITLELDTGEVRLAAGDCLVQRGARHRWRNHGTEPCLISFTNVSAR